ncbi:MAG: acyltransferase [Anaerolineae bacterium]|nr:acyltransferase [Anaerolineae bacterium]
MPSPIISPHSRIRHPGFFRVGEGSIVDDYCYFSTQVIIGRFSHIASGCSVAGGRDRIFRFGDYSSLSSGVKIWCTSDDFTNDMVTIIPAGIEGIKENLISGDVTFERLTAVGSNSVVMPDNYIPEGTVIGALSFVPVHYAFEPWTVYAGTPIRPLKPRNRESVLRQLARLEEALSRHAE